MVFSAMFSINYYKGFSLMRSSNIEETAYILCNNLIGCINMSILDKVNVKIRILNNDKEAKLEGNNPLEIYTVAWNEIKYKSGLCGFTFG